MNSFFEQATLNESKLFKQIDLQLLTGWECIESNTKKKKYLEELKIQTSRAMENVRYQFE